MLEKHFLRVKSTYSSFTMKKQPGVVVFTGEKRFFVISNENAAGCGGFLRVKST